ncbi:hypothetical protein [Sphingomonas faeni]|uniref:hypothetical protein n=1 Tax=Sphingomonas faeni TaxID=185950 RepID=UPI003353C495
MLVTFLGLVSASILPTISLLVNSMTASGRSVKAIDELESELQASMDALFLLFGCVGTVVIGLVALATQPPAIFTKVPYLTSEMLPRFGQVVVVAASTFTVLRIGMIPGILRRSLTVRHRIAVEEARRKTLEKAPDAPTTRAFFPTHPEFGKPVKLEDVSPGTH